jgi:hypothetical protein
MRKNTYIRGRIWNYLFFAIIPLTLLTYVLRGLGIFAFIPGGIILLLIILSLFITIFFIIDKTY